MAKDFKEICKAISADWKARRITHQIAAEKVGTTKQTISNQISAKSRFSVHMARKFAEAFGYDERFLLYGEGDLYAAGKGVVINGGIDKDTGLPNLYYLGYRNEPFIHDKQLMVAERIIEILNNKVAISAFHAYLDERYEEYGELIDILEDEYAYNCVIYGVPPKLAESLKRTRQWFTDVETKAAKELVLIEQKAASGELIDVDAEVERFRRRVLWIKAAHKEEAKKNHPDLDLEKYMPEEARQEFLKMLPKEDTE